MAYDEKTLLKHINRIRKEIGHEEVDIDLHEIIYDKENRVILEAASIHDCIQQFAEYTRVYCELFEKAMSGLDAPEDYANLYNRFSKYPIQAIYTIDNELYGSTIFRT